MIVTVITMMITVVTVVLTPTFCTVTVATILASVTTAIMVVVMVVVLTVAVIAQVGAVTPARIAVGTPVVGQITQALTPALIQALTPAAVTVTQVLMTAVGTTVTVPQATVTSSQCITASSRKGMAISRAEGMATKTRSVSKRSQGRSSLWRRLYPPPPQPSPWANHVMCLYNGPALALWTLPNRTSYQYHIHIVTHKLCRTRYSQPLSTVPERNRTLLSTLTFEFAVWHFQDILFSTLTFYNTLRMLTSPTYIVECIYNYLINTDLIHFGYSS